MHPADEKLKETRYNQVFRLIPQTGNAPAFNMPEFEDEQTTCVVYTYATVNQDAPHPSLSYDDKFLLKELHTLVPRKAWGPFVFQLQLTILY